MKKKNILPVVVLSVICIVVAALLAVVNSVTEPIITEREEAKANAALLVVLPGAKNFEELELSEAYPAEVKKAHKADLGFVFEVVTKGKDFITVMCGVDNDGKIVKLDVIKEAETPGYKELALPFVTGDNGAYNGVDAENLEVELFTGATMTSNGIYKAVKAALDAYTVAKGGAVAEEPTNPLARPESEILTLAAELVDGATGFTKAELDGEYKNLVSVYKENGGLGYVAYVLVISENYGTVESEALIYIGANGKIKDVNKLVFKTSDAMYGYVPPTEETVNEFYDRLPGSSSASIGSVELVSNATNTSTNVVASFKEALEAVAKLILLDMPTPEAEVISLAKELVGEGANLESVDFGEEAKYIRRIYRDKGGRGYVAYVVVISENYGTVESEALIYIGANGKIKDVNKLVFKTSDAMYGYVPPTEETVNEFYDRLPGNSSASIGSVELVSNATNTSTNVVASFKEALEAVAKLIALDMPTPEEELIEIANGLVGEGAELEAVDFGEAKYIRRIYRDKGGRGYVAYVVVISENYGTVETETLLHVGMDGKIKNVSKLTWKTSEAMYGYVPPTEETVNEFYGRLPGNNSATIESVELVSNATNTSTNMRNSLKEALDAVAKLISVDMPTPEAQVIALAGQLVGEGADLEAVDFGTAEYIRRIYKDKGGLGYVAYVVVISANYGTVETETLVHIGVDGRIKGVSKLTFKTSDAIYGYVPPTEAAVDAYYDRLPGNNAESIESVELVSNATNTSTNLRSSLMEALEVVDELIANQKFESDNTYKIIGISVLAVALVIFTAAVVISKKKRGGRNG